MCENHVLQSQARSCQYQYIHIKFREILSNCSQVIERIQILAWTKGHYSGTNVQKMMCNITKLDHLNMNAYINLVKFYQLALKIFLPLFLLTCECTAWGIITPTSIPQTDQFRHSNQVIPPITGVRSYATNIFFISNNYISIGWIR